MPCRCKLEEITDKRLQDLRKASNLGLLSRMTFDNFRVDGFRPHEEHSLREAYRLAEALVRRRRKRVG